MNNKFVGISIGVAAILLLVTFFAYSFFSSRWIPVVEGELSGSAKNEIEAKLMEWGQAYRVRDPNGTILVLSSEALQVRSRLDGVGLPAEQKQGFEMFNDSDYGLSEFVQSVNYRRALEAELERSVRRLRGIVAARVHLTLKRESIFRSKQESPKASVIVRLETGSVLSSEQIQGLQKIVSSSVEGLESDSVVIANESGSIISGDDESFAASPQFLDVELRLREKIEKIVDTFLGGDEKFSVALTVDINLDRVQLIRDTVLPSNNIGKELVVKVSRFTKGAEAAKSSEGARESRLEEEYVYSREKSEIKKAIGTIDHISVAVVVDGDLSEADRATLERVIAAAGGLSKARNDSVVVAVRAFEKPSDLEGQEEYLPMNSKVEADAFIPIDEGVNQVRPFNLEGAVKGVFNNYVVLVAFCLLIFAICFVFLGYMVAVRKKQSVSRLTEQERNLLVEQIEEVLAG